ncbi:MAG: HAD family phosphatase [Pseudomonadota bacterium]
MTKSVVIFDLGRVLLEWDPAHLYSRLIPDPARRAQFLTDVFPMSVHARYDDGEAFADLAAERVAAFPVFEAEIRAWEPRFGEMFDGFVPGMEAVLADLFAMGVPLYALSNAPAPQRQTILDLYPLLERFEGLVLSGEEKTSKPGAAIYRRLLQRYGLRADACVFLDDRAENIIGGEAVGIRGHVFKGADGARDFLAEAGLLK